MRYANLSEGAKHLYSVEIFQNQTKKLFVILLNAYEVETKKNVLWSHLSAISFCQQISLWGHTRLPEQ